MAGGAAAAGFFGKLPGTGDFVQRRLPADFVGTWDRSFEQAVAESRTELGDDWHAAWTVAPAWRFVLGPQACGASAWAGVTGPATDRVGRCFPMVIALELGSDASSCTQALLDGGRWFDAAARAHTATQADACGIEAFDARVQALSDALDAPPDNPLDYLPGIDFGVACHWRLPLPTHPASFLADLWRRVSTASGNWCLWWTTGGARVPPSVLLTNGLPQPSAYAGFIDANCGDAAWQSLGVFDDAAMPATGVAAQPAASVSAQPVWADDLDALFAQGEPPVLAADPLPAAPVSAAAACAPVTAGAPPTVAAVTAADPTPTFHDGAAVLQRADAALTLVAADGAPPDSRQQGAATVLAVARDLSAGELASGLHTLRACVMELNPRLRQSSEDLIDPVAEDCAVIAAHVADGQASLLRIGTAAAWHWRRGQLQPFFARSDASPLADEDTLGDLLFNPVSLSAPGLGAAAQPTCSEVVCAVEPGDRLLLLATQRMVRVSPEVLSRALAMPSCEQARTQMAVVAGLGPDPARWPLAIIEIGA